MASLLVTALGGIQMGLYLADRYDDGVAEPLSAWIGVAILGLGFAVGLWPLGRRSD